MISKPLPITFGALALGIYLWHFHQHALLERQLEAVTDIYGFVPVQAPMGAPANTVVILAPINCPQAGAQRAATLAKYLTRHGVPNVRSAFYEVAGAGANAMLMKATAAIATGTLPVVLVNGRGEDNPDPSQVVDEYRNSQR